MADHNGRIGTLFTKKKRRSIYNRVKPVPNKRRRSNIFDITYKGLSQLEEEVKDEYKYFYQPEYSEFSWRLQSVCEWFWKPQCSAFFIILLCFFSSLWWSLQKIDKNNEATCPSTSNIQYYKNTDTPYFELKKDLFTGNNANISNRAIPTSCTEPLFLTLPYLKNLYSVIQSTMIFMLVMTLSAGLDKYREEIRLFEALTGDIKALAMFMTHLTYEGQKYNISPGNVINYKESIVVQYEKIRILLAVLAPTARLVLKGSEIEKDEKGKFKRKSFADVEKLETKKNYKLIGPGESNCFPLQCLSYNFKCCGVRHRNECKWWGCNWKICSLCAIKYERVIVPWSMYNPNNTQGSAAPTIIEFKMYKKLRREQNLTGLDLFETVMSVLIDELMKVAENGLGFGDDEGSAVMSAIYAKWEGIYASWGAMSSIKTFKEPTFVHVYRMLMLTGYALMMPVSYMDIIPNTVTEFSGSEITWFFVLTLADICVFCLMWFIAYEIRNPFEDVRCMNGVKGISANTQSQVVRLLKYQRELEQPDYKKDACEQDEDICVVTGKEAFSQVQKPIDELLSEILKEVTDSKTIAEEIKQKIVKELKLTNRGAMLESLQKILSQLDNQNLNPELRERMKKIINDVKAEEKVSDEEGPSSTLRRRALNF